MEQIVQGQWLVSFASVQVELPCTGDYPTCVNCIRRSRVCTYPDPASYAHQFPRQSAVHARQLKDGRSGPPSPTKTPSTSPGKRPPGTLDPGPSPVRTGVLGGPVSLRDIVDPPRGDTRGGVLDAPPRAGVLDTPPRTTLDTAPRGILDAPRSAIEHTHTPQPTLYPSRALNPTTPTPPSMSVSPDSSGGASIQVLGATPKPSDQNGITPARPETELPEPSTNWNRSRTGSTSAEMSRTLSDINLDAYRPPQSQAAPSPQRTAPVSPPQVPLSRSQPLSYKPSGRAQSPARPTVQVTTTGSPRTSAPALRSSIPTSLPPRPSQPLDYRPRPRVPTDGRDRRDSSDKDRRDSVDRDRDRDQDRREAIMERRDSFDQDRERDKDSSRTTSCNRCPTPGLAT
ncbi:hypothetical protein B0J17DRAFT_93865 [Rhizoctonia solani]|nr:hypothetical protein B0J17DRAFT_93865 [Rhizoctonia solani]